MKKILLIGFSCCVFSFINKTDFFKLIEEKLNHYSQKNTAEKVYIQTDKPMYTLGEDIWFTAYLVNGITHQKSNKSKIVYVELINPIDSVIVKRNLYIDDFNIIVAGDFKIDEKWDSGNYTLRAYTNYMRNDPSHSFFQKEIPVYNVLKKDSITKIDKTVNKANPKKK